MVRISLRLYASGLEMHTTCGTAQDRSSSQVVQFKGWSSKVITCYAGLMASHRRIPPARDKVANPKYGKEWFKSDPWP